jgi:hypothetical protein
MSWAARRVVAKEADERLAHRRVTVLEPAQRLGEAREACRRGGIERTGFCGWRRFRTHAAGRAGGPALDRHPVAMLPEVVARIEALALQHPASLAVSWPPVLQTSDHPPADG